MRKWKKKYEKKLKKENALEKGKKNSKVCK